jgi:DNA-binding transcriptional ArsR family regulator
MTLTGMRKHVSALERAGLVTTEEDRARADLQALPARTGGRGAWIERYRQRWDARFDELEKVVEELNRKEKIDGRKKKE